MAWSPPARQRRSWLVGQAGDYATFQFHHLRDGTEPWSLTSLKERLIKLHAKVVSHVRYVTFQIAKTVVPRQMLAR